jgi:arsenate reductase
MQVTIYHNPNCGTSRNALAAIRAAGHEPQIFEYLTTPLARDAIAALIKAMNVPTRDIMRRKEPLYRELGLDEKDVTDSELLDAMAEHPILINRPIVVVQEGDSISIRLCRPSELVKSMLTQEPTKLVKAENAFCLSRIEAEGWKAACRVPSAARDDLDAAAIDSLNPYKLGAERDRWLAGFMSALQRDMG